MATTVNLNGSWESDSTRPISGGNGAGAKWFCDTKPSGATVTIANPQPTPSLTSNSGGVAKGTANTTASVNYTGTYKWRFVVSDGALAVKAEKTQSINCYYNLTVNLDGGDGSRNPTGNPYHTQSVTVSAGSKPGYIFNGWTASGVTLSNPSNNSVTFTMPSNDVTLTAVWEINSYSVTVNLAALGYTTELSSSQHAPGTTVSITGHGGTPPSGYNFNGWTVNSGGVTLADPTSVTTTFTMPSNNVTVTAGWVPQCSCVGHTCSCVGHTCSCVGNTAPTLTTNVEIYTVFGCPNSPANPAIYGLLALKITATAGSAVANLLDGLNGSYTCDVELDGNIDGGPSGFTRTGTFTGSITKSGNEYTLYQGSAYSILNMITLKPNNAIFSTVGPMAVTFKIRGAITFVLSTDSTIGVAQLGALPPGSTGVVLQYNGQIAYT